MRTRQHHASFSDQGVETVWKLADESFGVCHPRRLPYVIVARRRGICGGAVANVLSNRRRKQRRLLHEQKSEMTIGISGRELTNYFHPLGADTVAMTVCR